MEVTDGPAAISINPSTIKAAQEEMGRLDVLVCGQCHSVFHYVDEFQEHRSKEGACSKQSHFRESSNNEQKAQVWAFLLWKDTQIQQDSPDKDTASSWKLYKKWCSMEPHVRDCWITAGKTIQTFTKISNTKMTDVPRQQGTITTEGGRTLVVRKVIRNGQPDSPGKREIKPDFRMKSEPLEIKGKVKLKPSIKPKSKNESGENNAEDSDEEYAVEKILAKRFNPKKKVYEYLLKWEGYAHEHNTWEEVESVSMTCKQLMDEFEKNLAKQKELKAQQVAKSINKANLMGVGHKVIKTEIKPGPSSASSGRPMRHSKSRALDNVKQWVGNMKDEEERDLLGKRKIAFSDSDSDDEGLAGLSGIKRNKMDTSGDDDWTADSEEDKVPAGRSDVIQRAFSRATSNGSQSHSMLANAKGVKVEQKPQSTVYVVHRKSDGIIKLDSSPTNKITVKGAQTAGSGVLMVQNREGNVIRKQIVTSAAASANSITPVKVISKPDGTQVVTQMKVVPKSSPAGKKLVAAKNEPVKIQPKPDPTQAQRVQLITAGMGLQATTQKVISGVRPAGATTPRTSTDGGGRPLLPRPVGARATSTPTTTAGIMTITQTRTPVRAPAPKQTTPVGVQQRQLLQQQKKTTPTSTLVQVAASLPSIRPKITVMNQQQHPGRVIQKVVSPATRPGTKVGTPGATAAGRSLAGMTTQQKLQAAKKKAEQEAGVTPKAGARGNAAAGKAGARTKPKINEATAGNKPKESKLAATDGLHMEFHQVESEDSSDGETEFPPIPAEPAQQAPEPDSPPRLTLCPLTGRIIGPDGEPVEQQEPEQPEQVANQQVTPVAIIPASSAATIGADGIITTVTAGESSAELVLPTMEGLTDSSGAVMRVEMSPGGTTGMIVQTSEAAPVTLSNVVVPGPDLPCLDDPNIEVQTTSTGGVVVNVSAPDVSTSAPISTAPESAAVTTTVVATTSGETPTTQTAEAANTVATEGVLATTSSSNVKLEDAAAGHQLVTLTGEDGVVYQVAGQAENGQTLLVAQGADGEQQCVYVTTDAGQGEDGQVLTLDHAVAEAVAQLMPDQVNLGQQYYVKEGEATAEGAETASVNAGGQEVVMSVMDNSETGAVNQEEGDSQAQVVAQVIQADEPTPDGRRRVVLLLPDGNLMMTEVDEEQYAALELDK